MTDVVIPIEAIMQEVSGWADEIIDAAADAAVKEIRQNARARFGKVTGNLLRRIRKKKSKINKGQVLAGAFAPHAHLLEYGHLKVLWGHRTGEHVPGVPFVGPAEEAVKARLSEIAQSVVGGRTIVVRR